MLTLDNIHSFDWDSGNDTKNWLKHSVTLQECEEMFFNNPKIYFRDVKHSQNEERFVILGLTNNKRYLFAVFTIRDYKIRIISARDQHKKERFYFLKNTTNE